MDVLYNFLALLIALFALLYLYLRRHFSYWADRGVIHDKPILFYGNMHKVGRTQSIREPFREFYRKYKNQASFGGFYLFMRRAVVVFDLELIKYVLIKDFPNFAYRGNFYNERDDPLSGHLFNLDGPKWRDLRTKLTPTFTSGKMKIMVPIMIEVAEHFAQVFRQQILNAENKNTSPQGIVEIKELLARFTTDVIGNCAFGLECNSLNDPNTQFRVMGKKALSQRRHRGLAMSLMNAYPDVARKLGIKVVPEDISEFFMGVVRETVEYRERTKLQRNDFMNILLELRRNNDLGKLTLEEIAAQAFVFFIAGFETSSSTMAFALYELALNPAIQERARTEINSILEQHNGIFCYECINELKYLQQIVQETLRFYPIGSILLRKTVNDYPVPNTKHIIEKGTIVVIPVDAIQHDPDIYPDPEVFNPDRFTPEEIEKRHSMAWLPFGQGPRNCIGMRFGEIQTIVGLAMLLKNFRFTLAPGMSVPLVIDMNNFLLASEGGINLRVESI